jgi:hypothetical protein
VAFFIFAGAQKNAYLRAVSFKPSKDMRAAVPFIALTLLLAGAARGECLLFDASGREPAFQHGERVRYTLSYTWGVWVNVGEVDFCTSLKREQGRALYHVEVSGKTYPFFDYFFKVRDYFSTKIDAQTLQPLYMQRSVDEGGYRRSSVGAYDWDSAVIHASTQRLDRQQPPRLSRLPLTPCTFDVVSIFYYYRCCDFSRMKVGATYSVQLAMDSEVHDIRYKLHGAEKIHVKGVGDFRALKFSASLIAGHVFSGEEQVFFWVTDDENRVPIYIEAPVRVGSIRARIKAWEKLKCPLRSKL